MSDNSVVLDSTILYAFSGGQESDTGSIAGLPVLRAEKQGKIIHYTLPEDHGLTPGQEVELLIDWDRRYRLMKLHFAAELVLETVYRLFPGIEKSGAHISDRKARLDFMMGTSIAPHLDEIGGKVNQLIAADLAITSAFEDETAEKRFWEIEDFARVPCGGTHLKRTAEIGPVLLKRNNIGKGKERIEISLSGD